MTHGDFTYQRALAYFAGKWRECRHRECRERERCTGGPRGTCRRTGGWPVCSAEGQARLEAIRNRRRRSALALDEYRNTLRGDAKRVTGRG